MAESRVSAIDKICSWGRGCYANILRSPRGSLYPPWSQALPVVVPKGRSELKTVLLTSPTRTVGAVVTKSKRADIDLRQNFRAGRKFCRNHNFGRSDCFLFYLKVNLNMTAFWLQSHPRLCVSDYYVKLYRCEQIERGSSTGLNCFNVVSLWRLLLYKVKCLNIQLSV